MGDVSEHEGHDGGGFETRAVHMGQDPDPVTGAVVPPISLATTFAQDGVGNHRGFEYARSGNPTRHALETCVASLEQSRHGLAFASGLAAEDAVLRCLAPGGRVLLGNDAYGGTFRLISRVWGAPELGDGAVRWTAADLTDVDALAASWPDDTTVVWLESPTNPLLTCVDIEAVAALAHERGAPVVVDNTFATPYLQQPLTLGADVVVHSATKYLGGHSDVVGGFLAVSDDDLAERLRFVPERRRRRSGAVRLLPRAAGREDPPRTGWIVTAPTPGPWSTCSCDTRRWSECSTLSSPTIPDMRPPPSRCPTMAAW